MNTARKSILMVLTMTAVLVGSQVFVSPVRAANADPVDIDPDLAAKVAKEKLKQMRANAGGDKTKTDKSQCGKIDIGNDNNKSASGKVAPKNKTVIITGPVINAGKC